MTDVEDSSWIAVTLDSCAHLSGPFFHGTRVALQIGDELVPGHVSNFHGGRVMNHIYFTGLVDTAAWGAELSTALADDDQRGYVYEVQPTGPFEDDPNVTNKRFPGNITQSYRSRHPLLITGRVDDWQGHDRETIDTMLGALARLREQGQDVIED